MMSFQRLYLEIFHIYSKYFTWFVNMVNFNRLITNVIIEHVYVFSLTNVYTQLIFK